MPGERRPPTRSLPIREPYVWAFRRTAAPTSAKPAPNRKTSAQELPVFGNLGRRRVVVVVAVGVDVVVVADDVVVVEDPAVVVVVEAPAAVEVVEAPGTVEVVVEDAVVVVVSIVGQSPFVMVLVSSVTAPFRANSCPCTVAPVFAVMDVKAKI